MRRIGDLKLIGIALVVASIGLAQSQIEESSTPKFEVISVKLNRSPDPRKGGLQFLPNGRFLATNMPLIQVIAAAWNLPRQSQRLVLASGVQMLDDVYDIEAVPEKRTFPDGLATEERVVRMRLMVQALLEDRFKLSILREPREQPVYVLVVGKGGPKLERSEFQEQNCSETDPAKWISNPACHFMNGNQNGGLHGASVTISQVVERLQNIAIDRPLLDKTGLTAFYNIQTEGWTPMRPSPNTNPQGDPTADISARPTLFEIFERLGLRMESQRAIIDMFVIDHIEKPSEN